MRTFPPGVRLIRRERGDEAPLARPILVCAGSCRGFTAHNMAADSDATARYRCEECGAPRPWGH